MEDIPVSDVMIRDPITIKPDANLLECAKKMVKKKVGSLVISDKKNLLGIISQKDILWALVKKSKKGLREIKAMDIAPRKIFKIRANSTIKEAIERMKKMKVERLPVTSNNELAGIITIRDILNFNPEFYPELEEFSKIKEESKRLRKIRGIKKRDMIRNGICERCGKDSFLHKFNGMLLCDSCKSSQE